jgi:hypothetical protein
MVEYRLERLNDRNAKSWESFNDTSAEGSFFHSLKWKEIAEKGSDTRRRYFLLYRGEEVFGIFPFIEHNIHFFRGLSPVNDPQRLPAILKDYSDPLAMQFVVKALQTLHGPQNKLSFIRVSVSDQKSLDSITTHTLFPLPDIGDMVLDLSESPPEKLWSTFSAKKGQRKFIRRFDENGFSLAEADSLDDLELFYKYYEENIKRIGGKLQPYSRFTELWNTLADDIRITLLSKESVVAGGMLMISDKPRKTVYTTYLSLNRNLPGTYHPSYYLWWEAINWAWENKFEKVSFGAQHLDENNPRYRVKNDLGARFNPMYSRMVTLTKSFTMGVKWGRWRANHQSATSTAKEEKGRQGKFSS